jgi:hypothetical protein
MKPQINKYEIYIASVQGQKIFPKINLPKTRASKILQFKHYQTDAPI